MSNPDAGNAQSRPAVKHLYFSGDAFRNIAWLCLVWGMVAPLNGLSQGDMKATMTWFFLGLLAFCGSAVHRMVIAFQVYQGPEAGSRIRRVAWILSLCGLTALIPMTGFIGTDAAAKPWVYLACFMSALAQAAGAFVTWLMVEILAPDCSEENAGRTSDQ